ncbi:hypothetical protein Barb4_02536 [Bacteroidales bacterium Barb4]|nr:hypothetical protein Barb4_02536 [Bacteroidales bacterium Barb4]
MLQQLLVGDVFACLSAQGFELFGEYLLAERGNVPPQVPLPAALYLLLREAKQPAQQCLVLRLVETTQQLVDGFGQHKPVIHLNGISALQADFAGKGTHGLLEEAVDGADVKGGIVVKDGGQCLLCLCTHLLFGQPSCIAQHRQMTGRLSGRQRVKLLNDAPLHLVRRLVRKGNRKDTAIPVRAGEE